MRETIYESLVVALMVVSYVFGVLYAIYDVCFRKRRFETKKDRKKE